MQNYIFNSMSEAGILISAALGFIAGLIYNYILSVFFVFKKASGKVKDKLLKSFLLFSAIGIVGLGLNEAGMYLGIIVFEPQYYLVIKVFVAAVVLFWNYIARKILVFE